MLYNLRREKKKKGKKRKKKGRESWPAPAGHRATFAEHRAFASLYYGRRLAVISSWSMASNSKSAKNSETTRSEKKAEHEDGIKDVTSSHLLLKPQPCVNLLALSGSRERRTAAKMEMLPSDQYPRCSAGSGVIEGTD